MIDKDSMYNTPPCYNIYMLGLVLDWLEKQGGVAGMEKRQSAKAKLLYDYLDESALFRGCAERASRSDMNVTFRTGDAGTDAEFVRFSLERGLRNRQGPPRCRAACARRFITPCRRRASFVWSRL